MRLEGSFGPVQRNFNENLQTKPAAKTNDSLVQVIMRNSHSNQDLQEYEDVQMNNLLTLQPELKNMKADVNQIPMMDRPNYTQNF